MAVKFLSKEWAEEVKSALQNNEQMKSSAGAMSAYMKSRSHGFSPYATDASAMQKVVCYWGF